MLSVARTTLRELVRNPMVPVLSLVLAPFFVLLIWTFFPSGGSTTYAVVVVDHDTGATSASGGAVHAGRDAVAALSDVTYPSGDPILDVREVADRDAAATEIREHRALVFLELPETFSASVVAAREGPGDVPVTFGGDMGTPTYPVAAIMAVDALDGAVRDLTGRPATMTTDEVGLGTSGSRTEFEAYVPGVLVFAIGLMIFSAAMSISQGVENRTLRRLARTPVRAVDLIGGVTLVQVALGVASGGAALGTAAALGFRSAGPMWLVLPIWVLAGVSVVGLGMAVAALTKTVAQAFLLANFPFGVFMFLSGTMFPVHGATLFTVAGHGVNVLDLLPPRHAVNALSTLCTYGSTDVGYELVMLTTLSVAYFVLGAWLLHRRHLRAVG
jgi:ABC-2 type transport system permease protein